MKKSLLRIIIFFCYIVSTPTNAWDTNIKENCVNENLDPCYTSDITATIFGSHYQCNNEKYSYNTDNKEIHMSTDPNDCLNKVLEKYDLCPCPPDIKYDDTDNIIDVYTNMGDVSMKSC